GSAWAAMALAPSYLPPPNTPVAKAKSLGHRRFGLALILVGLAWLSAQVGGFPAWLIWPLGLIGTGALLAWSRLSAQPTTGWASVRRWSVVAVGLLAAAVATVAVGQRVLTDGTAAEGTLLALGAVAALVTLSAPWWWRLVRERDAERQARIRSDERAEVAAHLHDSVLQTLSLIQRHSDDPQTMLNLARRQERELRNWLDPDRVSRRGGSIRGQLDELATTVEEVHGVPVEVVAVGDCLVDDRVESLLGAAGEATVNAAKHSGADQIDIYLEVSDETIEVFVRDTGKGFELDAISHDRRGVRNSILGRMERAGGTAEISSHPGEGTEIELRLSRDDANPEPTEESIP
ncbi:MAG: ATP-binding protein, partial [Actinomycetota bacterium]